MRKRVIAITGVPGTGKTSLVKSLTEKLPRAELINVKEVIERNKLYTRVGGEKIAKMRELSSKLNAMVLKSESTIVVLEGHLLCDMKIKGATAVVLRSHLRPLLQRQLGRGYKRRKATDNVVAEAIDLCGFGARKNYKRVYETYLEGAQKIVMNLAEGREAKGRKIELLRELLPLIKEKKLFL